MKRKLVLKAEKVRVLTGTRLDRVVGGFNVVSDACDTDNGCIWGYSQMAICNVQGSKG